MIRSSGDTLVLHEGLSRATGQVAIGPVDAGCGRTAAHPGRAAQCNWRINGDGNAAAKLGLHPNTLRFRMKKLAIERPAAVSRSCYGVTRGTAYCASSSDR